MKTIKFFQTMQVLASVLFLVSMMSVDKTFNMLFLCLFSVCAIAFFQWGIKMQRDNDNNRDIDLENDLYERQEGESIPYEVMHFAAHMSNLADMFEFAHNQHVTRKLALHGLAITDAQRN